MEIFSLRQDCNHHSRGWGAFSWLQIFALRSPVRAKESNLVERHPGPLRANSDHIFRVPSQSDDHLG